jgi:hypothetical protein
MEITGTDTAKTRWKPGVGRTGTPDPDRCLSTGFTAEKIILEGTQGAVEQREGPVFRGGVETVAVRIVPDTSILLIVAGIAPGQEGTADKPRAVIPVPIETGGDAETRPVLKERHLVPDKGSRELPAPSGAPEPYLR